MVPPKHLEHFFSKRALSPTRAEIKTWSRNKIEQKKRYQWMLLVLAILHFNMCAGLVLTFKEATVLSAVSIHHCFSMLGCGTCHGRSANHLFTTDSTPTGNLARTGNCSPCGQVLRSYDSAAGSLRPVDHMARARPSFQGVNDLPAGDVESKAWAVVRLHG